MLLTHTATGPTSVAIKARFGEAVAITATASASEPTYLKISSGYIANMRVVD
jgi:hypothetical protein